MREYTWGLNLGGGIGGLLNLKQGGQDYAYLYDGKGNVAAVLDGNQAVVAAYRYAPFGKLLAKTGSLTQPFGFSTKRYDAQTGLIHYGFRFYEPEMSRWLTRDPLGEAGGMNLYAFVGNNPVNWVDPWGLFRSPDWMRALIPGQIMWDAAVTSFENGDYVGAVGHTLNMLTYQTLFVAMLGQSSTVQQAISCGIEAVGTGVGVAEAAEVGKSFGKLGTVVNNPGTGITGFTRHGLNQTITRGVSPSQILNTVRNPKVVLQQTSGNLLYLSEEAAVVVNNAGKVVTTYGSDLFDDVIRAILNAIR